MKWSKKQISLVTTQTHIMLKARLKSWKHWGHNFLTRDHLKPDQQLLSKLFFFCLFFNAFAE